MVRDVRRALVLDGGEVSPAAPRGLSQRTTCSSATRLAGWRAVHTRRRRRWAPGPDGARTPSLSQRAKRSSSASRWLGRGVALPPSQHRSTRRRVGGPLVQGESDATLPTAAAPRAGRTPPGGSPGALDPAGHSHPAVRWLWTSRSKMFGGFGDPAWPLTARDCQAHRVDGSGHTLAPMGVGVAIAVGAVLGLALGILVSVTTDLPRAPEGGLALGALVGWLSRRNRA